MWKSLRKMSVMYSGNEAHGMSLLGWSVKVGFISLFVRMRSWEKSLRLYWDYRNGR